MRNGHDAPQLISQLELSISGVGQLHKNPYEFISASRFDASFGDIGNGNERGVSTSRTGRSWVLFDDIDFGPDGADTVELPIFVLDGEPTTFRFWDGEPYAEGSTMIRASASTTSPSSGTSTSPTPSSWTSSCAASAGLPWS